jgi:type I restriction enzyme S subunit
LRKSDFQKSLLTLPSESLLVDFEDRVAAIKNKIAVNENQLNLLMNIRDNLLPRLISGRLRLPDAEEAGA